MLSLPVQLLERAAYGSVAGSSRTSIAGACLVNVSKSLMVVLLVVSLEGSWAQLKGVSGRNCK